MNYLFGGVVAEQGIGDGSVENVQYLVDDLVTAGDAVDLDAHHEATDRVGSAFALLLTGAGMPMFLAGEEFGEIHDLDFRDWQLKMEDPVDWSRRDYPGHADLFDRVRDLVHLRTSTAALQRDEVDVFHFDPSFDDPDGGRVFAYCRTGGDALGSEEQVVVVANTGPQAYDGYDLHWPWPDAERVTERGAPPAETHRDLDPDEERATLSLAPYQVRVFTT
jgi:1,4-alpha-glucan branching enzyme